jgi:MHS family proline/betaine transporter-like MFS transporter
MSLTCSMPTDIEVTDSWKKARIISLANIFEHYDYLLYGLFAPIFSVLFFPNFENNGMPLILAYGFFAVGYVFRPLGIFIWGHIADKYGRKPVLYIRRSLFLTPAQKCI